jgi:Tol biopolymer transport system component
VALTSGSRLGVYAILAPIGAGGMGQVFRARDTTLDRDVALKVLPDAFAQDGERVARFTREAKTLAALNHPHIAAIYGLESRDGLTALVMELVEGEDLSQRIARGAIPLDEALPIATQIAEALEAAHEQGIVHRDLKPANIKVRGDGTVKVLDFGLAKAMEPPASTPVASVSPTMTSPAMTQAGMILGTAAYMSPEQAKGRPVDRRADIWAFGAVLYEMLTGQRAFPGEDVTETIVSVISREPDFAALPATVPGRVGQVLRVCLRKDLKERAADIHDVRLALAGAFETAAAPATGPPPAAARGRLPWMAATAVAAAVAVATAIPTLRHLRETPPPAPPEMRVEITTPATEAPLDFALSPDGRALVFVASGEGPSRLWVRPLDQAAARPLAGTEGARGPFWSPDSRAVGFLANGTLQRLDLAGGAPQGLAAATGVTTAGSWNAEGTILFTSVTLGPLARVAAGGDTPVAVTQLDAPHQVAHRAPQFLPDGRQFLFYVSGTPAAAGIYLGALDGTPPTRLTAADSGGAFLPPDQVVFVRQGTLVARRLDLARRVLTGDPVTLADRVGVSATGRGGFAVSGAGLVAYRAGGSGARQLTWVDRTGKAVGAAGAPDGQDLNYPELSPDGRRVAIHRTVQGNGDLWLGDLLRGALTRLTFDAAIDGNPVWAPDGTRIAFGSSRTGVYDLYLKPSNGAGADALVLASPHPKIPQAWSRDGRWLLYYERHPTTGRDLWALDMTVSAPEPRVVANTSADELLAQFSPDGRWVAYQTNESGRFQVVVQPFPDEGGRWQVSTAGGVAPRWRADGKELYFLAPDATLMAAPVTAAGATFVAGPPVGLFPTRIVEGGTITTGRPQYAVAADGRFLINQPAADAAAPPITLILNWRPPARP